MSSGATVELAQVKTIKNPSAHSNSQEQRRWWSSGLREGTASKQERLFEDRHQPAPGDHVSFERSKVSSFIREAQVNITWVIKGFYPYRWLRPG